MVGGVDVLRRLRLLPLECVGEFRDAHAHRPRHDDRGYFVLDASQLPQQLHDGRHQ